MSPFEILGLPASPSLTDDDVQARFVDLSAQHHPDRAEATEEDRQRFSQVNQAFRDLQTTGGRLKTLLGLIHGDAFQLKGPVPPELLDRFASVGGVIQKADAFLNRKREASTSLAEALLAPDLLKTQSALAQANQALNDDLERARTEAASLDVQSVSVESAGTLCRTLLYLEKWQSQVQSRLHDLF